MKLISNDNWWRYMSQCNRAFVLFQSDFSLLLPASVSVQKWSFIKGHVSCVKIMHTLRNKATSNILRGHLHSLIICIFGPIYLVDQIGIWPNFWEKSWFLGFVTSRTGYRGKRLPLRYYKPSRWLKMLWGMVQILHEKLWGVQNYF